MRLNRYIAQALGISRRAADDLIAEKSVLVNGEPAHFGIAISEATDTVTVDGRKLELQPHRYIALHKPVGYVSSRRSQGDSSTLYELLPEELHQLKIVGRLDKDSSGLILLTNDGQLSLRLTHPSAAKVKVYQVTLDHDLSAEDQQKILDGVVILNDFKSRLQIEGLESQWQVTMREGKNRQIRRTFGALGYTVTALLRTKLGPLDLDKMQPGDYREIEESLFKNV